MDNELIISAFLAGLVMFFAPCTFPLIPSYLAFITGSTKDLGGVANFRKKVFLNGLFFIFGFSLIYILLGSMLGLVGQNLSPIWREKMMRVGGLIILVFGLHLLGVLKIPYLYRYKKITIPDRFKPGSPISSFVLGFSYGTGWSPCQGPVLGSIATLAATSANVHKGVFLFMLFSLGLSIPFLLIALFYGSVFKNLKKFNKLLPVISAFGAIMLIVIGIFLVTDNYGLLNGFFFRHLGFLNSSNWQDKFL